MSNSEEEAAEKRRAAARILGGTPSAAKRAAGQQNARKATAAVKGKPMSEEHRAKIGEGMKRHWEQRRAEKEQDQGRGGPAQ